MPVFAADNLSSGPVGKAYAWFESTEEEQGPVEARSGGPAFLCRRRFFLVCRNLSDFLHREREALFGRAMEAEG